MLNWPAVVSLFIVAAMNTVLTLSGHANAITLATSSLGGVGIALINAAMQRPRALPVPASQPARCPNCGHDLSQ